MEDSLSAYFDETAGQVVPIEYHTWWPSNTDSFYRFNTSEIITRINFYGIDYTPAFRYDGKKINDLFGTGPAYPEYFAWLRAAVDSLAAIPSPLRINLAQYLSGDSDSVYVSFDVVAVDTIIYDVTPILYLAVVENSHTYPAGTGRYSFRDMLPDGDGEIIAIQKGDSLHFDWAYPVSPVYTLRELLTTVMVQNRIDPAIPGKQRNRILQATSAWVLDRASVAGGGTQPKARIWLGQNAPNPFSSGTTIAYNLSDAGKVRMSVYTPTGRLVTQLVDGYLEPGSHYATWNGRDRFGKEVGSGVYYYLLNSEKESRTGRMVLLK